MEAIRAKNLAKKYGSVKAVDNISFDVKEKSIFGFLGPNGAGKSTTQRILTGVIYPDAGNVEIMGHSLFGQPIKAKQKIGVVPEQANVYVDLTAWDNLKFIGEIYNMKKEEASNRAEELLKLFNLYEKRNLKARGFSKGMKQRLLLCMALLSDPLILFLDEPTTGLDVESKQVIREMIRDFHKKGKTIFLTTHDIEEANMLCDEIAIINRGKIAVIDRPADLKQAIQKLNWLEVAFDDRAPEENELARLDGVEQVKKSGDSFILYTSHPGKVIPSLGKLIETQGLELVSLHTQEPVLEEVFLHFINNEDV
ncbi:MAG: ATP-binding cassette domain-containing protein [Bacillota bacterium]